MCLRLREQCLRSEITSVSRVANVLLLRFVAGKMDVNTPASKRSQLIGNTAIVRIRRVIHKQSTCVCLRLSVAAFTRKRKDARFDLWPALEDNVLREFGGAVDNNLNDVLGNLSDTSEDLAIFYPFVVYRYVAVRGQTYLI